MSQSLASEPLTIIFHFFTLLQRMYCAFSVLCTLNEFRGDWLRFQGKEIWVLLFRLSPNGFENLSLV